MNVEVQPGGTKVGKPIWFTPFLLKEHLSGLGVDSQGHQMFLP